MSESGKRTGSRDLDAPCEDQHQTQPESCGSRLGAGMHRQESLRKSKNVRITVRMLLFCARPSIPPCPSFPFLMGSSEFVFNNLYLTLSSCVSMSVFKDWIIFWASRKGCLTPREFTVCCPCVRVLLYCHIYCHCTIVLDQGQSHLKNGTCYSSFAMD